MIARGRPGGTAQTEGVRRDALSAVDAALEASHPSRLVKKTLRVDGSVLRAGGFARSLRDYRRVVLVGGGKASALMAAGVVDVLGGRLDGGLVIVPEYQRPLPRLKKVEFARSTHPYPSEKGARAVRRMLRVLDGVREGDLVVALISGGGSALMASPLDGITVEELVRTTSLLLKAGAEISEVNCVRKHLSQIGGGRLLEATKGADVLALVISDVVGNDMSTIASGPTVADPTTYFDARRILRGRRMWNRVPISVRRVIQSGMEGKVKETLKPGDKAFETVSNVLAGSNSAATSAVKRLLEARGYMVSVTEGVTGEARVVGRRLARLARGMPGHGRRAVVWGGETTVTVKGDGTGGRNQELALAAAIELNGSEGAAVISFGTDGVDGATNAAGAYADSTTFARAEAVGLDPRALLENNDSHAFFEAVGGLVVTGPTGTNVNDVMIALKG